MNLERSSGAVVFTRHAGQLLYLVVQERSGAYSFPKGHVENAETDQQAARREILEETGLSPAFIEGFCEREEYSLSEKPGVRKQVTYFLAEFHDEPLIPQACEIRQIRLLPYEQALTVFSYEGTRQILTAAHTFLTKPAL